ncbi:MAG: hypothetical protein ACOYYS_27340 [Chloroflexota bacterium]
MKSKTVRFGRAMVLSILFLLTVLSLPAGHGSAASGWNLVHCWAGALLLIGSAVHLGAHRDWVRAAFSRPAASLQPQARTNRRVDFGLLLAGAFCAASGALHAQAFWSRLHTLSGIVMIVLVAMHLWLHRQWMANAAQQMRTNRTPQEAPIEKSSIRR